MSHLHIPDGVLPVAVWLPGLAAALLLLTATGWLPGGLAAVVAALAGFGTGLAGPSRDMLIKRAAPPGATGRVAVVAWMCVCLAMLPAALLAHRFEQLRRREQAPRAMGRESRLSRQAMYVIVISSRTYVTKTHKLEVMPCSKPFVPV